MADERTLAKALGWFSIGLGVAELAAPGRLSRLIGLRERNKVMRALGMREITSGVGILTRRRPAGWLWSRVAGDAIDLGLLVAALRTERRRQRKRLAAATAAVAGVALLDLLSSRQLTAA